MAAMIPNLDDLAGALPDTVAGSDAAELIDSVRAASSWRDVDEALDRVCATWASA